eukprot:477893-Pyramimonas_sp.AAC.1
MYWATKLSLASVYFSRSWKRWAPFLSRSLSRYWPRCRSRVAATDRLGCSVPGIEHAGASDGPPPWPGNSNASRGIGLLVSADGAAGVV